MLRNVSANTRELTTDIGNAQFNSDQVCLAWLINKRPFLGGEELSSG